MLIWGGIVEVVTLELGERCMGCGYVVGESGNVVVTVGDVAEWMSASWASDYWRRS